MGIAPRKGNQGAEIDVIEHVRRGWIGGRGSGTFDTPRSGRYSTATSGVQSQECSLSEVTLPDDGPQRTNLELAMVGDCGEPSVGMLHDGVLAAGTFNEAGTPQSTDHPGAQIGVVQARHGALPVPGTAAERLSSP